MNQARAEVFTARLREFLFSKTVRVGSEDVAGISAAHGGSMSGLMR